MAEISKGSTTSKMHSVKDGDESHRTVKAKMPDSTAGMPPTQTIARIKNSWHAVAHIRPQWDANLRTNGKAVSRMARMLQKSCTQAS